MHFIFLRWASVAEARLAKARLLKWRVSNIILHFSMQETDVKKPRAKDSVAPACSMQKHILGSLGLSV